MSDKSVATEQALADLQPTPWLWFGPFINGWRLGTGGFGYVRYWPLGNSVEWLFDLTCSSPAIVTDTTKIATLPATDRLGNNLWPPVTVTVHCATDLLQSTTPGSPRLRVAPTGAITVYGVASGSTWLRATCQKTSLDNIVTN
jgi:hypothetical protein